MFVSVFESILAIAYIVLKFLGLNSWAFHLLGLE